MAVATKEIVMEPKTQEAPKTFKVQEEQPPIQEYHYLHRVVGMTNLPDGTLSGDRLDLAVMEWLNMGWRILPGGIHFLGQHKGAGGEVFGYVYGYHLVRG